MNKPLLMGILNITPDSFSDGGKFAAVDVATARFRQLLEEGADIVDVGAESTRPGATPLTHVEEWARLEPLLQRIVSLNSHIAQLSIDTRHAETARKALAMGVSLINDVAGLRDPVMRTVLADSKCDIVVMHALTIPADRSVLLPKDADPISVILNWKKEILTFAKASGIAAERLIFDPGIGFGKSAEQSLTLILRARELIQPGERWLFGHSRKSFLTLFTAQSSTDSVNLEEKIRERDALTLAFSSHLMDAGVSFLRIHHVRAHKHLLERLCI